MISRENQSYSLLSKLFLRFTFLYLLFYIYPYGFEYIQELNTSDYSIWKSITIWFGETFLGFEMDRDRLLNGFDSQYDYSRFLLITVLAIIGTFIWIIIDSKFQKDYDDKLNTLTRTILRYHVGLTLIIYGLAKVFMLQFGVMGLDTLESKVGDNNAMGFLWTFMSYSKFYTMSTGWIEFIGGVLLLFRRTTFIGSFILFLSMINVVLIDIGYDVRVKMFAIHLLIMTVLLLSSHFKSLINLFLLNKPTESIVEKPLFVDSRYVKVGYFLKAAILTYFVISCFITYKERIHRQKANRYTSMTRYHKIEHKMINGDTIAVTDSSRWNILSINGNKYRPEHLRIVKMDKSQERYSFTADTVGHTIDFITNSDSIAYQFRYKELEAGKFIFDGVSAKGDSIWFQTTSKSLNDYPLSANHIRWITDLKD